LKTGILALQGSFQEHLESLKLIERDFILIRTVDDLEEVGSIILPGGESTSMIKIQENNDLFNHLKIKILTGIPTLGTCAGLILLAKNSILGKSTLNILDCDVERNGYGRQNQSFEGKVQFNNFNDNYCFIRAPKITSVGSGVKVIAKMEDEIVGVQSNNIVGLTFHPELNNEQNYLKWLDNFVMKGSNVGAL